MLDDGRSCAHGIASCNWTESLRFIKESGANLNLQSNEGRTPLAEAVENDATDSVRLFLELGVDANVTDSNGEVPLHLAVEHGHVECVKLLLAHGADVESITECYSNAGLDRMNALELAAFLGHVLVLEIMLERVRESGYDPGDRDSVLSAAIKGSQLPALKYLLKENTRQIRDHLLRPDKDKNSLLHTAVLHIEESVRRETIHELLQAGMPIDFRIGDYPAEMTRTALAISVEKGDVETTAMLLARGASPYCRAEDKEWSFVHEATVHARRPQNARLRDRFDDLLRTCQSWISEYQLFSRRDLSGRTPLHLAVYCGQAGVAKSLIIAGCPVYDKVGIAPSLDTMFDMSGMTALELAYELATVPAKKRESHLSDIRGVPDEDLLAVTQLLKTWRAPGEHRRLRERMVWRLRKWRRHWDAERNELAANLRKALPMIKKRDFSI